VRFGRVESIAVAAIGRLARFYTQDPSWARCAAADPEMVPLVELMSESYDSHALSRVAPRRAEPKRT
jgi:hypothetical protein